MTKGEGKREWWEGGKKQPTSWERVMGRKKRDTWRPLKKPGRESKVVLG